MPARIKATALALSVIFTIAACGGDPKTGTAPPPANGLAIVKAAPSGDGQSGTVQQPLAQALRVVVLRDGQPEAGVTVSWSSSGTGGTFNPASSTSDANGVATTVWTLPQEAGVQAASATVSGAQGSPLSFGSTAVAGAPAALTIVSGNNQEGGRGEISDLPLRVKVADQYGNGISGINVSWDVLLGDATVPLITTTGTNGTADAFMTYGTTLTGPIAITAEIAALENPVTFTAIVGYLVEVINNQFVPADLRVALGDYVVWRWSSDARSHNVEPDDGFNPVPGSPARSGDPRDGPFTYSYQFNTRGNFQYFCVVHLVTGMTGLVGVN